MSENLPVITPAHNNGYKITYTDAAGHTRTTWRATLLGAELYAALKGPGEEKEKVLMGELRELFRRGFGGEAGNGNV